MVLKKTNTQKVKEKTAFCVYLVEFVYFVVVFTCMPGECYCSISDSSLGCCVPCHKSHNSSTQYVYNVCVMFFESY